MSHSEIAPAGSSPASAPVALALTAPRNDSPNARAMRRFRQHKLAMLGSAILLVIIVLAIAAPLLAPIGPVKPDLLSLQIPPSSKYILGTDMLGRDVWARLLYGGRISMSVGVVAVGIYVVIGTLIGSVSGYVGGWVDTLLQRLTETVMCFPTLIIIITVVAMVGPSIYNVFLAIGLLNWTGVARLLRGQFLSLRACDFVLAARALGVPTWRIVFRHILPNALGPLIVAATLGFAGAILTETGLSYLGLGVPLPTPSWGNMIRDAQTITTLETRPWLWIPPGLAISISVLSINFIGDGLRDAFDPRSTR